MKIKPLKKNSEFVAFVSDINLKDKLNKIDKKLKRIKIRPNFIILNKFITIF